MLPDDAGGLIGTNKAVLVQGRLAHPTPGGEGAGEMGRQATDVMASPSLQ